MYLPYDQGEYGQFFADFSQGEDGQFFADFNPISCSNDFAYQLEADPFLSSEDAWAFAPNYQQDVHPLQLETIATHCVQNNAATSTTEVQIQSESNEYGRQMSQQDNNLDIIETLCSQNGRLGKLETIVQKLEQASPKFPKESVSTSIA